MSRVAKTARTRSSPTLLPHPALSEVSGNGSQAIARRTRSRAVARALLPRGIHAAGSDRRHRLSEQGVIYDLLFKAAAEATLTIAADSKHLGARIGITAVLHTWGSAL